MLICLVFTSFLVCGGFLTLFICTFLSVLFPHPPLFSALYSFRPMSDASPFCDESSTACRKCDIQMSFAGVRGFRYHVSVERVFLLGVVHGVFVHSLSVVFHGIGFLYSASYLFSLLVVEILLDF